MSDHHCPGLAGCENHPKWSVVACITGEWAIYAPFETVNVTTYPTLAEAINHATRQARKERV